jgi:hypothetical protein
MNPGRGHNNSVGKVEFHLVPDLGCGHGDAAIEVYNLSLLHERRRLERSVLATLLQDLLAHIKDADRRH